MVEVTITPLTELGEWVDGEVIAQSIMEGLEDEEVPATLENGKAVWLDVLEQELSHAIRRSVKALIARGELV